MTRYAAGPRAGIAQAAPVPHRAERAGTIQVRPVPRPASDNAAALPADPFARRPWLRGRGRRRLSGRPAVFVLASLAVFFAGSAIAGAGFGSGFQGGIRIVVPLAAAHQRAGLVSLLYVVSYLGLGVPAVLAGFGVVHGGGLVPTTRYYGAAVIALAALALSGLLKNQLKIDKSV